MFDRSWIEELINEFSSVPLVPANPALSLTNPSEYSILDLNTKKAYPNSTLSCSLSYTIADFLIYLVLVLDIWHVTDINLWFRYCIKSNIFIGYSFP
jgi:hypothetical protein